MTQLVVLSRDRLEQFQINPNGRYGVISITDNGSVPVRIPIEEENILRLSFSDIDRDTITDGNGREYFGINQIQSVAIAEYVRTRFESLDCLIVQCEAGISRSAGVTAAISRWAFGNDDEYFNGRRFIPNRRCYRMVLDCLMNQ